MSLKDAGITESLKVLQKLQGEGQYKNASMLMSRETFAQIMATHGLSVQAVEDYLQ